MTKPELDGLAFHHPHTSWSGISAALSVGCLYLMLGHAKVSNICFSLVFYGYITTTHLIGLAITLHSTARLVDQNIQEFVQSQSYKAIMGIASWKDAKQRYESKN